MKHKTIVADIALLLVVLIWGTTFPLMKDAIQGISPLNFIFLRFTIAALIMTLFKLKDLKNLDINTLKVGFYLGLALTGGFIFQVSGLQFTTASKAGFITGLSVVIVPIIATIYFKKLPTSPVIAGIFLATIGLFFLSYNKDWIFNLGDILVFFCALSFGTHIFLVGHFAKKQDPALLNIIQIAVVGIVAGILSGFMGELKVTYPLKIWSGLLYMAVMATGVAFFIQNWAQQFTSAIRTAIIFSAEPVFALIFSYLLLGEIVTYQSVFGGGLIIAGMIFAEIGDYLKFRKIKGDERNAKGS